ncbi:MAG: hypothetical protein E6J82_09320 [Deltaproteobacteria bacterium]|nr:MAG: hypothetical protein E6J82_09320 [Deltaproteobacteria bacterium]
MAIARGERVECPGAEKQDGRQPRRQRPGLVPPWLSRCDPEDERSGEGECHPAGMQPEERGSAGGNPCGPPQRGAAQLALGQRDEDERKRDRLDEVEEAQIEGNGVEHRRREDGKAPIASEGAEEHPERSGGRRRDQREHDPHGRIGSRDLRDRGGRQIEAEVLEPPEIDLEPLVEGGSRRVEVGKDAHRRDVLGRVLVGQELARPQRRDGRNRGESDEQRPDELLRRERGPRDGKRNRLCPAALHHLRP